MFLQLKTLHNLFLKIWLSLTWTWIHIQKNLLDPHKMNADPQPCLVTLKKLPSRYEGLRWCGTVINFAELSAIWQQCKQTTTKQKFPLSGNSANKRQLNRIFRFLATVQKNLKNSGSIQASWAEYTSKSIWSGSTHGQQSAGLNTSLFRTQLHKASDWNNLDLLRSKILCYNQKV